MASENLVRLIEEAAKDIQAIGQYPSADRVREALGNRGSLRDINAVLKKWRENNSDMAVSQNTKLEVPVSLTGKISELVLQYAEVMSARQRIEHNTAMQVLEQKYTERLKEKEHELEILTIQLHQTNEELRKVREELRASENRLHRQLGKSEGQNDLKAEVMELLAPLASEIASRKGDAPRGKARTRRKDAPDNAPKSTVKNFNPTFEEFVDGFLEVYRKEASDSTFEEIVRDMNVAKGFFPLNKPVKSMTSESIDEVFAIMLTSRTEKTINRVRAKLYRAWQKVRTRFRLPKSCPFRTRGEK